MEPRDFWDKMGQEFLKLLHEHEQRDLSATVSEGGWVINEGCTAWFRSVFESLATAAAIESDPAAAEKCPVDFWLTRLRQGPHFTKVEGSVGVRRGVTRRSRGGGWIDCLCLASADYCIELRETLLVKEAATLLSVPPHTVYRMIKRKELEAVKVGTRLIRIPRDQVARLRKKRHDAGFLRNSS